ncbi:hypothetical protein KC19_VG133200 [Ceratodon purpureus]|uniref:Uncharacterized protein n=1 Tax=Ceratodon purpureus TaxID=3225 RepID=A0A8T0HQ28_CERPU|nr:hypothetical protein KC19_VG133200 [Ceratodon purpureus]
MTKTMGLNVCVVLMDNPMCVPTKPMPISSPTRRTVRRRRLGFVHCGFGSKERGSSGTVDGDGGRRRSVAEVKKSTYSSTMEHSNYDPSSTSSSEESESS